MIVLAFDPGLTGAIAVLDEDRVLRLEDMPVVVERRKLVDAPALAELVREAIATADACGCRLHAAVEAVATRPGEGAVGAFGFGRALGIVEGVLGALQVRTSRVSPQTWKRHAGLVGAEKDASRAAALRLYPECAALLRRKKDHGRADAVLMGRWLLSQSA